MSLEQVCNLILKNYFFYETILDDNLMKLNLKIKLSLLNSNDSFIMMNLY